MLLHTQMMFSAHLIRTYLRVDAKRINFRSTPVELFYFKLKDNCFPISLASILAAPSNGMQSDRRQNFKKVPVEAFDKRKVTLRVITNYQRVLNIFTGFNKKEVALKENKVIRSDRLATARRAAREQRGGHSWAYE